MILLRLDCKTGEREETLYTLVMPCGAIQTFWLLAVPQSSFELKTENNPCSRKLFGQRSFNYKSRQAWRISYRFSIHERIHVGVPKISPMFVIASFCQTAFGTFYMEVPNRHRDIATISLAYIPSTCSLCSQESNQIDFKYLLYGKLDFRLSFPEMPQESQ